MEVMLRLFSREGLSQAFELAEEQGLDYSDNVQRMIRMKPAYLQTIETVIDFLQDKNPTLAYHIAEGNFLPQAERFSQLDDVDWAFGSMGLRDKARYLSTLYLEDLGDLITEAIDPHFGFSRYAEQLGMSASTFDGMEAALQEPVSLIDALLLEVLEEKIRAFDPASVALSIPFPRNLYGGDRKSVV